MSDRKKKTSAAEDDGLPEGWSMAWSTSKQKVYYCNKRLGVSQWSKPTKNDEVEILQVLSEMNSTNKARNTMIRNARKRLKERDKLIKSGTLREEIALCDEQKTSSKSSADMMLVHSGSCLTDDKCKKEKSCTSSHKDFKNTVISHKTSKLGIKTENFKHSLVKFSIKKGRSKVLKDGRKDSSVLKAFDKKLLKHDTKDNRRASRKSGRKSEESPHSQREASSASLCCHDLYDESHQQNTSLQSAHDLDNTSTTPSDVLCGESADGVSTIRGSFDEEEDMEYETSPVEYAKLMNEINEIRETFGNNDILENHASSSHLLGSETSVVDLEQSSLKVLYLIIDTNILLNSLHFLRQLEDIKITDYSGLHLVIPWIVMTELDLIKDNKKKIVSDRTQKMATLAVSYLYDHLRRRDQFILTQTPSEVCIKYKQLEIITNNDDKILQCCIQWKEKYPSSEVFLLTGDTHLCNKAMVIDIPAHKEKTLQKWLKERKVCVDQNIKGSTGMLVREHLSHGELNKQRRDKQSHIADGARQGEMQRSNACQSLLPASSDASCLADYNIENVSKGAPSVQAMEAEHFVPTVSTSASCVAHAQSGQDDQTDVSKTGMETISDAAWDGEAEKSFSASQMARRFLEKIQYILVSRLSTFVEHHMKSVYDDLWMTIIYRKPPWNLDDLLHCLKKHWIAVFGDLLGRKNITELCGFIAATEECNANCYDEVLDYLNKALSLCELFKQDGSDRSFDDMLMSLNAVKSVLEKVIRENLDPPETCDLLDQWTAVDDKCSDIVQSAFQDVWFKILNTSTEMKALLQTGPSAANRWTVVSAFADFCALVAQIHHDYRQMLSQQSSSDDTDYHLHLYTSLIRSLSDFSKHHHMLDWRKPSPVQVYNFVNGPRGRTIISNGYLQLQNLISGLCDCNSYLSEEERQFVQSAINKASAIS